MSGLLTLIKASLARTRTLCPQVEMVLVICARRALHMYMPLLLVQQVLHSLLRVVHSIRNQNLVVLDPMRAEHLMFDAAVARLFHVRTLSSPENKGMKYLLHESRSEKPLPLTFRSLPSMHIVHGPEGHRECGFLRASHKHIVDALLV